MLIAQRNRRSVKRNLDTGGITASAEESPESTVNTSATCLGCGTEVIGAFCHACGRRTRGEIPTLPDFLAQSAAEAVDFGLRLLPTLRTLALQPGKLTREFIEGRGPTATHPVRLFITSGVVAFLATRISPGFLFRVSLSPVSAGEPLAQGMRDRLTLLLVGLTSTVTEI